MKAKINTITESIFQVSLFFYLILLTIEMLVNGFVSEVFNLNIMLGIVLGSGIAAIVTQNNKILEQISSLVDFQKKTMEMISSLVHEEKKKMLALNPTTEKNFYYILTLSVISGVVVFYKIIDLGPISIVISVLSSLLVLFISGLIIFED